MPSAESDVVDNDEQADVTCTQVTDLPREIVEMILIKGAVAMHVFHRTHLQPQAGWLSLLGIVTVCSNWRLIFSHRRYNRRRIRLLFKQMPMTIPLVLMKAVFLFRKPLAKVALQHQQARDADVTSVKAVATVCRRWFKAVSGSETCSRRRLKRLFLVPQLTHVLRTDLDDSAAVDDPDADNINNAADGGDVGGSGRYIVSVTSVDSQRLFVLHSPSEQKIEVYDTETFKLQQAVHVEGLGKHSELTSCVTNNCLYANAYQEDTVYKIELDGDYEALKWQVNKPISLAVNRKCNLLVSCWSANKLQEYTTNGLLVSELYLHLTVPLHVTQLTSNQFLAGFIDISGEPWSYDVVEMNLQGRTAVSYTKYLQTTTKHQFSLPCHLTADRNNDRIFVADHGNNRIVMLDRSSRSALEFDAFVNGRRMQQPCCLHFDESSDRLYVVEPVERGRIFVFDVGLRRYNTARKR